MSRSLTHHYAGWFLRALSLLLVIKTSGLWLRCIDAIQYVPREGWILTTWLLLLMIGWVGIFWRRGTMLMTTQVPFPVAIVWLTFRAFFDAIAATILALGLIVCSLLIFGGPIAQESMLNISFASHITTEHIGWSALINWTLHSSTAVLFYSAGLRFDDALDHLKKAPVPVSPAHP